MLCHDTDRWAKKNEMLMRLETNFLTYLSRLPISIPSHAHAVLFHRRYRRKRRKVVKVRLNSYRAHPSSRFQSSHRCPDGQGGAPDPVRFPVAHFVVLPIISAASYAAKGRRSSPSAASLAINCLCTNKNGYPYGFDRDGPPPFCIFISVGLLKKNNLSRSAGLRDFFTGVRPPVG